MGALVYAAHTHPTRPLSEPASSARGGPCVTASHDHGRSTTHAIHAASVAMKASTNTTPAAAPRLADTAGPRGKAVTAATASAGTAITGVTVYRSNPIASSARSTMMLPARKSRLARIGAGGPASCARATRIAGNMIAARSEE